MNSMPSSGPMERRNIRPVARSASLSAISTVISCLPALVTKVSGSFFKAAAGSMKRSVAATKESRAVKTAPLHRFSTDATNWVTSVRRRERCGGSVWPELRRHEAFGATAEAYQDGLSGPQLREAEAPQGLHMHEDVLRAIAPRDETEALQAVEPF